MNTSNERKLTWYQKNKFKMGAVLFPLLSIGFGLVFFGMRDTSVPWHGGLANSAVRSQLQAGIVVVIFLLLFAFSCCLDVVVDKKQPELGEGSLRAEGYAYGWSLVGLVPAGLCILGFSRVLDPAGAVTPELTSFGYACIGTGLASAKFLKDNFYARNKSDEKS